MASLLQRLGLFSARRRWWVLVAWIVILGGVASAYATAGGTLSATFSIPGTPAQKVNDQLTRSFPSASGGTGQIVFSTREGDRFTPAQQAAVHSALQRAGDVKGVNATPDPFESAKQRVGVAEQLMIASSRVSTATTNLATGQDKLTDALTEASQDGPALSPAQREVLASEQAKLTKAKAALGVQAGQIHDQQRLLKAASGIKSVSTDESTAVATVQFTKASADITPAELEVVRDAVTKQKIDGVAVAFDTALADPGGPPGTTEAIGVVIAAIVLFIMLGSMIAAGLPLLSAIVGVGVGALGVLSFSSVVDESATTPILGLMLGLAVGIDYSLFILNRHRQNLRAGIPLRKSIGLATGTSGSAVLFAGITVIIALAALNVTGIGFLGLMGTAGAVCVAIAVLVSLTLTPAMLAFAGTRVLPRKERLVVTTQGTTPDSTQLDQPQKTARKGRKDGNIATRHPVLTIVTGLAVLLVLALPAMNLRLALPDAGSQPAALTQYKAYSQIGRAFGAGMNGAIIVVATVPRTTSTAGLTHTEANVADRLLKIPNVTAAALGGTSNDNQTLIYQVIPKEGPTALSTERLVKDLRAESPRLSASSGVTLGVTGLTAINIDISEKLGAALPLYLIVVLGLSILIMILVFRSLLIPLTATAGFLLSILATLGTVTAVFQYGWGLSLLGLHTPAPVLSILPTLLVGIVFGLAMDYQLFLVSGMREAHAHGKNAKEAVRVGLSTSKAVITAAGIIMIGVFGGFALSQSSTITPIGLGLGLGVLIDAFIVRMLLIPAAMTLLGEAAWWLPSWIDKILPNVDVEGSQLESKTRASSAPRISLSDAV